MFDAIIVKSVNLGTRGHWAGGKDVLGKLHALPRRCRDARRGRYARLGEAVGDVLAMMGGLEVQKNGQCSTSCAAVLKSVKDFTTGRPIHHTRTTQEIDRLRR